MTRETRYGQLLEGWGVEWMLNGVLLLLLYGLFNVLQLGGVTRHGPYYLVMVLLYAIWLFVTRREKPAGPPSLIEWQVMYIAWNGVHVTLGVIGTEWMLEMPAMTLAPIFSAIAAGGFLLKANLLSGRFFYQVIALTLCGPAMLLLRRWDGPDLGLTLLGVACFLSFFIPGWRFYQLDRQRRDAP